MSRTTFATASIAICALLVASASAAPGDIVELGSLGGANSFAYDINGSGEVAGYAYTDDFSFRAFKHPGTAGGAMLDLGTFGGTRSEARGINDRGTVVGYAYTADTPGWPTTPGIARAFKHPGTAGGILLDLGTLGGTESRAFDINGAGEVVGFADTAGGGTHAFKHPGTAGGTMIDLGTLGGTWSAAAAINDAGEVVGNSTLAGGGTRAFKHPGTVGGTMIDLGTLGGTQSSASDINEAGEIVGQSLIAGDASVRAFRHDGTMGGMMMELGTLGGNISRAYGINADGAVVGVADTSDNVKHAVLWQADNSIIDLDVWLDTVNPTEGAHWWLTEARAINDSGLVAGFGYYSGSTRGFILDASSLVPEPSAVFVLALASPLMLRRTCRTRR